VRGSIRLGKVLGIPVEVNASWVLIFLLLTYVLAQEFESARLGWPAAQRWSVAIATVVLFFLSVLAHELSHSVVAKRKGIPVQSITLFIFGGVSRLAQEPDRPMTEFTVAGVGPLSSIILAAVLGGLWYLLGAGDSILEVVLFLLAWTNLWLGVFNILPGYPLDGGHILRAAVWGLSGSYWRATRVAARSGQAIGALTVLLGVVLGIFVGPVNGVWVAVIGSFLFSVATASYREERSRETVRQWKRDTLRD
jgi:Zn-dependent protease